MATTVSFILFLLVLSGFPLSFASSLTDGDGGAEKQLEQEFFRCHGSPRKMALGSFVTVSCKMGSSENENPTVAGKEGPLFRRPRQRPSRRSPPAPANNAPVSPKRKPPPPPPLRPLA